MYLKRYSALKHWLISKKAGTWVVRPSPGPHKKNLCIPLQILLRDILKYADNAREAKKIIKAGKIQVDKRERKNPKYPAGLMDLITIANKNFRILPDKNGLRVEEANSDNKLCKIVGKRTIRGGIFQLNLHDGRNILTEDNKYKVGDSLSISLPDQKILDHFQLKENQTAYVISGRNAGFKGTIKTINKKKFLGGNNRIVLEGDGKKVETLKRYIFVVGETGKNKSIPSKTEKKEVASKDNEKKETPKKPKEDKPKEKEAKSSAKKNKEKSK